MGCLTLVITSLGAGKGTGPSSSAMRCTISGWTAASHEAGATVIQSNIIKLSQT